MDRLSGIVKGQALSSNSWASEDKRGGVVMSICAKVRAGEVSRWSRRAWKPRVCSRYETRLDSAWIVSVVGKAGLPIGLALYDERALEGQCSDSKTKTRQPSVSEQSLVGDSAIHGSI